MKYYFYDIRLKNILLILNMFKLSTYPDLRLRGLLVAVGRCNTQVRLSLIYVPVSLLDLRYLGSSEEGLTFGHT